jgi:pyruvate/2-oxoglutarate dehydrogenase complex dihydrolipoamide acyltransferase (E2) component
VERDVRAALAAGPKLPKPTVAEPASVPVSAEDQVVKLTRLRQITAQRTAQSKQQAPHFYVTVAVDVDAIQTLRKQFEAEGSGKVSINDFVIRACALALRDLPEANASFQGDSVVRHGAVNIGMAVAVPDGLTVPVIKNADGLSLLGMARVVNDLANRARNRKLQPDEVRGGTFTLTNHGISGSLFAFPVINQPQCGILGVGAMQKRGVVETDELGRDSIAIRPMVYLSFVFDHRILDGASADWFLAKVKETLEKWG